MTNQRRLSPWAAYVIAGALTLPMYTASASSVYYNTSQAYASDIGTDNNVGQDGIAQDPNTKVVNTTFAGWDTSTSLLPFGFNNERLNWAAEITASGDALTVSSQDAQNRYGIWADIDTAQGAWFNEADGNGWEHQTDVGLIKSDVDTVVTINVTGIDNPAAGDLWTNFGVSVYSGMPEGTWKFHAAWNQPAGLTITMPDGSLYRPVANFEDDNPLTVVDGLRGGAMSYITHDGTVDSVNSISFNAAAGTVYTILLGGYSGGNHFDPKQGYAVNIATAAPVPVPTSLWLFGGALFSLTGAIRKKLS